MLTLKEITPLAPDVFAHQDVNSALAPGTYCYAVSVLAEELETSKAESLPISVAQRQAVRIWVRLPAAAIVFDDTPKKKGTQKVKTEKVADRWITLWRRAVDGEWVQLEQAGVTSGGVFQFIDDGRLEASASGKANNGRKGSR